MPPTPPNDTLTATRFLISIDGAQIASFSELVGITTEVEPVEYLVSADQAAVSKKSLGMTKPPTIALRRGQTAGMELWAWHETVVSGNVAAARKNCSLTMFNVQGNPVARFLLFHAWPSKLEISALKAGSSSTLLETLTLVCERLQRVAPS